MTSYKNKIVIVTGAGSGIGKCVAHTYAEQGAQVIIAERNAASGKSCEESIRLKNGKALFIKTDVGVPADIVNLMSDVKKTFGTIDILINNAGYGCWKSPYDISVDEWDEIIQTNLRGCFLCSREASKIMRKNARGSIVNIASTRALMSEANSEAYAASKGGIVALTHALSASLAKDNIQVNCISPGWIATENYEKLREEDHLQHFSNRVGVPADIANACLFLTNPENNFINGQNIVIDGGMTKKMIYIAD